MWWYVCKNIIGGVFYMLSRLKAFVLVGASFLCLVGCGHKSPEVIMQDSVNESNRVVDIQISEFNVDLYVVDSSVSSSVCWYVSGGLPDIHYMVVFKSDDDTIGVSIIDKELYWSTLDEVKSDEMEIHKAKVCFKEGVFSEVLLDGVTYSAFSSDLILLSK